MNSIDAIETAGQTRPMQMSVFEHYLTLSVTLCMVAGVAIGKMFPTIIQLLRSVEFGTPSCSCDRTLVCSDKHDCSVSTTEDFISDTSQNPFFKTRTTVGSNNDFYHIVVLSIVEDGFGWFPQYDVRLNLNPLKICTHSY